VGGLVITDTTSVTVADNLVAKATIFDGLVIGSLVLLALLAEPLVLVVYLKYFTCHTKDS